MTKQLLNCLAIYPCTFNFSFKLYHPLNSVILSSLMYLLDDQDIDEDLRSMYKARNPLGSKNLQSSPSEYLTSEVQYGCMSLC